MPLIDFTPWDSVALGMWTGQLTEYSEEALITAAQTAGHHTIKVPPLSDKRLLQKYGFYYCDTLIEPYCRAARLHVELHQDATISKVLDREKALSICSSAFSHDRFHRDFNVPESAADRRYVNWLMQLLDGQQVYGLYWQGTLAGFIGYSGNSLVLHALAPEHRGKGRAKYWWSAVCSELLTAGDDEIKSSISAANLAALNLYASLGFSFRNPQDVYHRMTA